MTTLPSTLTGAAAPNAGPAADAPTTADPTTADPRAVVDALAGSVRPYLIGVRHHSPALAAVVPALLDAAEAEVVCIELPADFQRWLPYLSDPAARAPLALVGSHVDVADRIEEYHALGLDHLILSGQPHLEEAYTFGEGVLPILRRRGLLADPEGER